MFTANIAGSAGSHLRPELPHRDSYPHNRCQFHQCFMSDFFVHKSFRQLFSSYVRLCDFWPQNFVRKMCAQNVDEIDHSNPNLLDIEGESYAAASAEEKRYLVNISEPT